jgi:pimeloyl-ACP methyl ester carboxylesterase
VEEEERVLRMTSVVTSRGNTLDVATIRPDGEVAGPPVLLLHPINLRKECWLGLLPVLAADRACVLVDLAGHGDSTDEATFSLQAWVTDCVEVVEHLGLDVLHVMGGSLGGAIGLGVTAGLPGRVLSVTGLGSAIEPHPDPTVEPPAPADDAAAEELFEGLAREAVAPGADESVVRTVRRLTNRHGADAVTKILRAAYSADASAWLEDVRCPALWLTGEHDVTLSVEAGEDIARRLGGRHHTLSGVGHLPMIEDAEAVLAQLVPHLRSADALVPGR